MPLAASTVITSPQRHPVRPWGNRGNVDARLALIVSVGLDIGGGPIWGAWGLPRSQRASLSEDCGPDLRRSLRLLSRTSPCQPPPGPWHGGACSRFVCRKCTCEWEGANQGTTRLDALLATDAKSKKGLASTFQYQRRRAASSTSEHHVHHITVGCTIPRVIR